MWVRVPSEVRMLTIVNKLVNWLVAFNAHVAQWIEREPSKLCVAGPNPVMRTARIEQDRVD